MPPPPPPNMLPPVLLPPNMLDPPPPVLLPPNMLDPPPPVLLPPNMLDPPPPVLLSPNTLVPPPVLLPPNMLDPPPPVLLPPNMLDPPPPVLLCDPNMDRPPEGADPPKDLDPPNDEPGIRVSWQRRRQDLPPPNLLCMANACGERESALRESTRYALLSSPRRLSDDASANQQTFQSTGAFSIHTSGPGLAWIFTEDSSAKLEPLLPTLHSKSARSESSIPAAMSSPSPSPTPTPSDGLWTPAAELVLTDPDQISASPAPEAGVDMKEIEERARRAFATGDEPPMLPGEHVLLTNTPVALLNGHFGPVTGVLYVTNFRVIFKAKQLRTQVDDVGPVTPSDLSMLDVDVPIMRIASISKIGGQIRSGKGKGEKAPVESAYGLEIACKDLRVLRLGFVPQAHSRRAIYSKIVEYAAPKTTDYIFAFCYGADKGSGWAVYDPIGELKRLGVPDADWRITEANAKYEMIPTYPAVLACPAQVTDEYLQAIASFRSKGRLPAFVWRHPGNRAVMLRCAQPRVGAMRRRCSEDEEFVEIVGRLNQNNDTVCIVDARPYANAVGNQAKGLGMESTARYRNVVIDFMGIGNIHVMRASLEKLRNLCISVGAPDATEKVDPHWFSYLEATDWLLHLRYVLLGALRVVEMMDVERASVIVHCSDGWDRTSQLTALAQLLMDPYYRTLRGFEVLVEKEWCAFGHMMAKRNGHVIGSKPGPEDQRSPVFLQFIDAVWQVTQQFPCAFEFNQHFLIFLLDELYACRFGNFLFNSEKERVQNDVYQKCVSIWAHVNSSSDFEFINPHYSEAPGILLPVVNMRMLQLWTGYFLRYSFPGGPVPRETTTERTVEMRRENESLRRKIQELESKAREQGLLDE